MYDLKHIYIISPSGYTQPTSLEAAKVHLESWGFKVTIDPAAANVYQRFAGTDKERVDAIERAIEHEAGIILASRGGYGLTRLLPAINWKKMVQATQQGKRFVGYSDFTALNLALLSYGGVSYSGPCAAGDFASEDYDEMTKDIFCEVMSDVLDVISFSSPGCPSIDATGILWGGNLSMLVNLLGTPYFPQVGGGILVLEDVAESPYRIERMLTQLLYAGVLEKQTAIIMGAFTEYKLYDNDNGFNLTSVFDWLRTQTNTPIFTDLPYGHTPLRFTLPIGRPIGIASEQDTVHLVYQFPTDDHSHDHSDHHH